METTYTHSPAESAETASLLARCPTDMDALEALYHALARPVFAFAFTLLGDFALAEECVQETFVRLPAAAARLRAGQYGKTFVLGVAKNIARELIRRQSRHARLDEAAALPGAPDFTEAVAVSQLLGVLNGDQRQVVVLHVYAGLTFKEIARIMRRPASTVKSQYARARRLLKQEWEDSIR